MSNYVYNYLLCDNVAKKRILSLNSEDLCMLNGFYDKTVLTIEENRFLVIFETRGMEYRTEFIERFITEFNTTRWYCIEENEIEQGYYFWNGSMVEFTERKLVETLNRNEIVVKYLDDKNRPLRIIFISDNQIIIENILKNEVKKYIISENTGSFINSYINYLMDRLEKNFAEYLIPLKDGIQKSISIHWNDKSLYIETDEQLLNFEEGELIFDGIIALLNDILFNEGIEEIITFNLHDIV